MIHKLFKPAALLCAVAALAGCAVSPVPVGEFFQPTYERKVGAAGHWSQVSQEVVEQTVAVLQKSGATTDNLIYVPAPANASDFDRAFHEMMVTGLVRKGWQVQAPGNTLLPVLTLNYRTQIVKHHEGYSTLYNEPGLTELVLTSTVTNAGRYITRKTDVYYIQSSDAWLYASPYSNPAWLNVKSMKVVSQ